jgi:hypothetical protein
MSDSTKYNPLVSWRTLALNVYQLTRETVNDPATYRITVNPIDRNDLNAGTKTIGYYFTDYNGIPYTIINTASTTIDVSDDFKTGLCPTSGRCGIVHKSAYKGYSLYLPSHLFRHLHPIAIQNNYKYSMSILWGNDPNPRRISFSAIEQPAIADYRSDLTDMDGITFNPSEDYGQHPKFEVWQEIDTDIYSRLPIDPVVTRSSIDGLIDSVIWSGTGETITGYIIISR